MLIVMGAVIGVSVAELYAAAFGPGFLLAGIYLLYLIIRSYANPKLGPPVPMEERVHSVATILWEVVVGVLPLLLLIAAVLGSMLAGLATPTEASAIGAFGAWLSDLLLYVFGLSAWWWVAFCAYVVVWGWRRLEPIRLPLLRLRIRRRMGRLIEGRSQIGIVTYLNGLHVPSGLPGIHTAMRTGKTPLCMNQKTEKDTFSPPFSPNGQRRAIAFQAMTALPARPPISYCMSTR